MRIWDILRTIFSGKPNVLEAVPVLSSERN